MIVLCPTLPRSGSSCLAGVLHHLGVNMGDQLNGANEWNKKGHFEDTHLYDLYNRALGFNWQSPDLRQDADLREELRLAIACRTRENTHWGSKDARLIFCWPLMLELMPKKEDIRVITTLRPLQAVKLSVAKRHAEEVSQYSGTDDLVDRYLAEQSKIRIESPWPWLYIPFRCLVGAGGVELVAQFLGLPVTPEAKSFPDAGLLHFQP